MHVKKIIVSNRTKDKADHLKTFFKDIEIIDWGKLSDFDMIINATSIGLKKGDKINLDFALIGANKYFFDVIYNPKETDFLRNGKNLGHSIINGKFMFIYQALLAFNIWHNVKPDINDEVTKLFEE